MLNTPTHPRRIPLRTSGNASPRFRIGAAVFHMFGVGRTSVLRGFGGAGIWRAVSVSDGKHKRPLYRNGRYNERRRCTHANGEIRARHDRINAGRFVGRSGREGQYGRLFERVTGISAWPARGAFTFCSGRHYFR